MKKCEVLLVPQVVCGLLVGALLSGFGVRAQAQTPTEGNQLRVFHLKNVAQHDDAGEILTALRNVLSPSDRIYLVYATNDIVLNAPASEIAMTERLVSELDRPKLSYRLLYTLTESDGGKKIGVQHFAMVMVTGQRVVLKQGDKVPVLTGSYETDKAAQQTQFTYLDVGINLDSTLEPFANGLRLRSKVEQSSVAEAPNANSKLAEDPIVRQSSLEGTSVIVPGKALTLGGIDIVGSTRHIDVEVVAEPLS